jgi:ribosomal protein S18 acetylase RimI-like enzyme
VWTRRGSLRGDHLDAREPDVVTDPHLRIRSYRAGDDPALMRVCVETGDAGKDATPLLRDPTLQSHVFLLPYLDLAPELASVVAAADDVPVGYVLGALDSRAFEAASEARVWPRLREHYPLDSFPDTSLDALFVHLIHHPDLAPEALVRDYPSHLHIDLLPQAQRGGWGRRLLERLFDQLAARGSTGVHLGVSTANTNAVEFYRHIGFDLWGGPNDVQLTFVRRLGDGR